MTHVTHGQIQLDSGSTKWLTLTLVGGGCVSESLVGALLIPSVIYTRASVSENGILYPDICTIIPSPAAPHGSHIGSIPTDPAAPERTPLNFVTKTSMHASPQRKTGQEMGRRKEKVRAKYFEEKRIPESC